MFYICFYQVERNYIGTQATFFLHIATNRFFAIRKFVFGKKWYRYTSDIFSSYCHEPFLRYKKNRFFRAACRIDWLKYIFLLFYFNFQVRKKNAGQSFLAMKEVQDNQAILHNLCRRELPPIFLSLYRSIYSELSFIEVRKGFEKKKHNNGRKNYFGSVWNMVLPADSTERIASCLRCPKLPENWRR